MVWAHKTSLTPPLFFIEVPVTSQESELSCMYVKAMDFFLLLRFL